MPFRSSLFKNPKTEQTIDVGSAPLDVALFGFFYFAKHKVWKHAWGGAMLALVTGGISWLIYPIYAERIMRRTLISRNWIAIPSQEVDRTNDKFIILLVALLWTFVFCVVISYVVLLVNGE